MDIPLQKTLTAPAAVAQQLPIRAVSKTDKPHMQTQTPAQRTIPAETKMIAAVNEARISAQSPSIPEIMAVERVLKPYGVTMLPSNETGEKLVQHQA